MTGAGGGESEERSDGLITVDGLTSIFTRWAKEQRMSSFAHALGSGHVRGISPEVERVVLVAGHGSTCGGNHRRWHGDIIAVYSRSVTLANPWRDEAYASTGWLASSCWTIFSPRVLTLSELVADASLI